MSNFDIIRLRLENIGSERDKVAGSWRKLHTEELHNYGLSPDIVRAIQDGHIKEELMGEATYLPIQCQSYTEQRL